MAADPSTFLPLAPAPRHILMALARGELHGYGIMQEVASDSNGACRIGPVHIV